MRTLETRDVFGSPLFLRVYSSGEVFAVTRCEQHRPGLPYALTLHSIGYAVAHFATLREARAALREFERDADDWRGMTAERGAAERAKLKALRDAALERARGGC